MTVTVLLGAAALVAAFAVFWRQRAVARRPPRMVLRRSRVPDEEPSREIETVHFIVGLLLDLISRAGHNTGRHSGPESD